MMLARFNVYPRTPHDPIAARGLSATRAQKVDLTDFVLSKETLFMLRRAVSFTPVSREERPRVPEDHVFIDASSIVFFAPEPIDVKGLEWICEMAGWKLGKLRDESHSYFINPGEPA